jgi:hypothetical protein
VGRAFLVLVTAAVVSGGSLYVALPPGGPDPIRAVRRPVMRFLRKLGVCAGQCGPRWQCAKQSSIRRETAYRGLFWSAGERVTCRYWGGERRALRLCYVANGKRHVAAETTGDGALLEVAGLVPKCATGYWTEETGPDGVVRALDGWGDVEGFWPVATSRFAVWTSR